MDPLHHHLTVAGVRVQADKTAIRLLVRALKAEADGKQLRLDLVRNMRAAAEPALQTVRASILSMSSKEQTRGPSLRTSIAAATKIHVRLSGNGVAIISHNRGIPRNFKYAARRLNSEKPWRHPVFGNREVWVSQVSTRPRWFSDPLKASRSEVSDAVREALYQMAQRISARTRG